MCTELKKLILETSLKSQAHKSMAVMETDAKTVIEKLDQLPDIEEIMVEISDEKRTTDRNERLSDLGNAKRLDRIHGKNLLFCPPWDRWLIWDGTRWQIDETLQIDRLAASIARDVDVQAVQTDEEETRKLLRKHATACESAKSRRAAIDWARSLKAIAPAELDRDLWLLNCLNGTIDLRTGELRKHRQEDLITKMCPVKYKPGARSEIYEKFLERVLPDPEVRHFIHKAFGYTCTGSTREELLFFVYGPPGTGKSTLMEAAAYCLGEYATSTSFETFLQSSDNNANAANPALANLEGARFVRANEAPENRRMAESVLNHMTGGDMVTTRNLYQNQRSWLPTFKLWLIANDEPRISSSESAIWRRLRQIVFDQQIPESEINLDLKAMFREPAHAEAIFAWLIEGCRLYLAEGLKSPGAVLAKTEEYRAASDPLGEFICECCELDQAAAESAAYLSWAQKSGEKFTISKTKFGKLLERKGCDNYQEQTGKRARMWQGIRIRKPMDDLIDQVESNEYHADF
jgi:putative DNA primase/helicase